MNRKYTTEEFFQLMQKILNKSPLTNFTTDYIVGFPTETEEDQKKSVDFLNKIKLYDMHIFPYSKRDGTVAAKIYKDLPKEVKMKRVAVLEEVKKELKEKFINENSVLKVLIEEEKDGYFLLPCRRMRTPCPVAR